MKREFRVGDKVIFTNKIYSDEWERYSEVSLYKKKGTIIGKESDTYYVKFNKIVDPIYFKHFPNEEKNSKVLWIECDEIELDLSYYKLKKWIRG